MRRIQTKGDEGVSVIFGLIITAISIGCLTRPAMGFLTLGIGLILIPFFFE